MSCPDVAFHLVLGGGCFASDYGTSVTCFLLHIHTIYMLCRYTLIRSVFSKVYVYAM